MTTLIIILWALSSIVIGKYAKRLGHNQYPFILLSLILSPFVIWLLLYVVSEEAIIPKTVHDFIDINDIKKMPDDTYICMWCRMVVPPEGFNCDQCKRFRKPK